MIHVVALAGGVGGAKLVDGLAQLLPPENLTVIVNTGDDFDHLGLKICPDLDTVCYTLAGLANPASGWGRQEESWNALGVLKALGGPDWFNLGDRDLGLHLERTRRLQAGQPLSQVTADFCRAMGVKHPVLPMSDQPVPTRVFTSQGELAFQEYFVHRQCQPEVNGFRFDNVQAAQPAPGALKALAGADVVVFCPSNPWVSIDPILAVPGMRQAVGERPVVAVSPIIGGQTVKGPAAKMYAELGITPSALAVALHYRSLLAGFVFDNLDESLAGSIEEAGMRTCVTDTLMVVPDDRKRLAGEVIQFCQSLVENTGPDKGK
ncbi:MAG TPA: 2-phospho-L-lactate transferase [Anaerolineales bacterium]|nr:2-phospho-L-lactate transferase [Anaerolineales bacterium]